MTQTATQAATPTGPLKGFRILDLTTVLFGPFGAQTLGDWGADIIKVEGLNGDTWRTSGQFRNRGMSGQFMAVNRNKRSIAIDLKHPEGKEVLRRLIEAGVRVVTLNYSKWDWHGGTNTEGRADNSIFLREAEDFPVFDQCVSALIEDLHQRGLAEDCAVIVWGEFGRTPKISAQVGRDLAPPVQRADRGAPRGRQERREPQPARLHGQSSRTQGATSQSERACWATS